MNRVQYKLLDRMCRILRRAPLGIDKRSTLVITMIKLELQLEQSGIMLEPGALDWLSTVLPEPGRFCGYM